jgi:hypothetical protein
MEIELVLLAIGLTTLGALVGARVTRLRLRRLAALQLRQGPGHDQGDPEGELARLRRSRQEALEARAALEGELAALQQQQAIDRSRNEQLALRLRESEGLLLAAERRVGALEQRLQARPALGVPNEAELARREEQVRLEVAGASRRLMQAEREVERLTELLALKKKSGPGKTSNPGGRKTSNPGAQEASLLVPP